MLRNRELLSVAILSLAFYLALYFVFSPAFSLDEAFYTNSARDVIVGKGYTGWIIPPLFTHIVAGFYFLFGQYEYVARTIAAIFGLLSVITVYFLGKRFLKERYAALAALLLTVLPAFTLLSQRVMTETSYVFFWTASLLFFVKGIDENKNWLLLSAALFALGFMIKFSMVLLLPIMLFYLFLEKKVKTILTSNFLYAGVVLGLLMLIPMFLYSQSLFGNYTELFIKSFQAYSSATSPEGILFYPTNFFFVAAATLPLLIYGSWEAFKTKDRKFLFVVGSMAFLLVYRTLVLEVRETRYLIDIVPFVVLLSASAFSKLYEKFGKKALVLLSILVLANVIAGIYLVNSFANNEKYVGMKEASLWAKDNCSPPVVANIVGPAAYYTGFEIFHMNNETLKKNVSCFIYSKYEVVFPELEARKADFIHGAVSVYKNR